MSKGKNWVDYKEIKAKITMQMVLEHYGLMEKLKPAGKNLAGCCPIHRGSGASPRQFSVCLEKNIWNCFGDCKSGGNILDFVSKMEDISIRDAALKLRNLFLASVEDSASEREKDPGQIKTSPKTEMGKKLVREKNENPSPPSPVQKNKDEGMETPESIDDNQHQPDSSPESQKEINPPLKFELKTLDPEHPFFQERGILPETVKHFGLGYCSKGILKDRIAIPIHDDQGHLVAYCGRAVSREQIDEKGKYKLPANFIKSEVVYNLNRQKDNTRPIIMVESYFSVFKLHQNGFSNVVAIMGSVLSKMQEKLILSFFGSSGRALLMFDADEDGQKCAGDCLIRLSPHVFVKSLDISQHARKPHQLTPEQIGILL